MTPPRAATSPRRPVPAPERPRYLHAVPGLPVPGRRPPASFVAATVFVTVAALLGLVVAQVLLGQAGFTQAELEARVVAKRLEAERLELVVAGLRAPARVAARAAELGLVPAGDVTALPVRPSLPAQGPSPKRGRP